MSSITFQKGKRERLAPKRKLTVMNELTTFYYAVIKLYVRTSHAYSVNVSGV